jgi:hypothetical protein
MGRSVLRPYKRIGPTPNASVYGLWVHTASAVPLQYLVMDANSPFSSVIH